MDEIKLILCCGAGMSSGFLSNAVKKAAKKRKIACCCSAQPESNVANVIKDGADILCIGPHYAYMHDTFKEMCEPLGIEVIVIPKDIYGTLDGNGLLDLCIEHLKSVGKSR